MENKVLSCLGMILRNRSMHDTFNHKLQRKQPYDTKALTEAVRTNVPKMNHHQKITYDTLIEAVINGTGGIYSLDAPGRERNVLIIAFGKDSIAE